MDLEKAKERFAHSGNEAAVLACVLKDGTNYFEVEAKLSDQDFLRPHHRALWIVIKSLVKQNAVVIDAATLLNQAIALGVENKIAGPNISAYDYINTLFEKSIDPANIDFYIERLVDASTKLKILQAADEVTEITEENRTLTGETLDAGTIVADAQEKFLRISVESARGTEAVNLADGITELLQEVTLAPSNVRGFPTGFQILDEAINGLEPGTLTVLGARPKVGKSTILMNWAKSIAYDHQHPILYIDTEMSGREQQFRLLSLLSAVPERQIKNGTYVQDPANEDRLRYAQEIMNSGIILHKYFPDFTAETISAMVRKYHHQGRAECVFFDYIKLADADLQMAVHVKEYQALGYLCVALKNLAGQLQIPIVTAAQLNREGANKGYISSAQFADSDRILRYANTLLGLAIKPKDELVKTEEEYGRDVARELGTHRLQVLDTRAGGGANFEGIDLYFRKEILTMREANEQKFRLQMDKGVENES